MKLTRRLLLVGMLSAMWSISLLHRKLLASSHSQFSSESIIGDEPHDGLIDTTASFSTKAPPPNNSTKTNSFNYLPTGKWRKSHGNQKTAIAPFCCGNGNKISYSPQLNKDTNFDQNVENVACSTIDHSLRHMSNWGCACRLHDDQYVWDNLPSWNASAFCHKLGLRKVLLVGDSTMQQARELHIDKLLLSSFYCGDLAAILHRQFTHLPQLQL